MAEDTRDATEEELEHFRRKWQEEVSARNKAGASGSRLKSQGKFKQTVGPHGPSRGSPQPHKATREVKDVFEGQDLGYHDLDDKDEMRKLGEKGKGIHPSSRPEPSSALEHYERAVEREDEGNLGDSLNHYRKAYKLDASVDRIYKNKHFPPAPAATRTKPQSPNSSKAPVTVPNPAHHSLATSSVPISELIASFAVLSIPSKPPPTEASPPPPCPIASAPSEILVQILSQLALIDPSCFSRLALVCKRLAYLVAVEDRIWRQVCHDDRHGFLAMHYSWGCNLSGTRLPSSIKDLDDRLSALAINAPAPLLPLNSTYPSYRVMYRTRPRIRFSGCYISTVNYIRPGGVTASQVTWNSPVLIVTYYRYLRFFRDGSCVSLLTTTEPIDVVHHLTKENMRTRTHPAGLPTAVMNHALKGRWRLSGDPFDAKKLRQQHQQPLPGAVSDQTATISSSGVDDASATKDNDDEQHADEDEGVVRIETEGADVGAANPKYLYKIMLKLQHAGSGGDAAAAAAVGGGGKTRSNKLAWMGYWSYNRLSDDWAEFGLRNDRAFFWSRVKSYGDGE